MKKFKAFVMILMMIMLVSSIAAPAFAAEMKGEEINLDKKGSYKLIVPNFIEHKIIKKSYAGKEYPLDIIVVEMPQKNADGTYPIYEIITTDKKANIIASYPNIFDGDFIGGVYQEKFVNGSLVYAPKFTLGDKVIKDIVEGNILTLDFIVYDDDYRSNDLFTSPTLYFMFENKGGSNASAEEPLKVEAVSAKPAASKVVVNGKEVAFEAYEIAGSNYFKLRDLAKVVNGTDKQFEISWDGAKNAISLTTGAAYTSDGNELTVSANPAAKEAKSTESKLYLNGQELQLTAYNINDNNYFKLRDIAKAIDFAVTWDAKASTVGIDTSAAYTE